MLTSNSKNNRLVRRLVALILIAQCSLISAYAGDDFGIWGELRAEKGLGTRWDVGAEMEYRSRDNLTSSDRWGFGIDASYKLTPWLKATAGYVLLRDHNYKEYTDQSMYADYWGTRHRFNMTLTSSITWNQFTFSLRERWQYTYRPEKTAQRYYTDTGDDAGEKTYSGKGKNVWRNRIQVKMKLSNTFRPYVNAESYVATSLEKMRYNVGTEIVLDKHNSFDVKYIYQHRCGTGDGESDRHVIGIGYTYQF